MHIGTNEKLVDDECSLFVKIDVSVTTEVVLPGEVPQKIDKAEPLRGGPPPMKKR